jgi:uncharacterized protein (UPF0276 family)
MPDVGRVLGARVADHDAPTAGLGLRSPHYADAADAAASGLWFEVHSENYMVDGGPRLAWLETIRTRYPLSLHGVGLSLGADAAPDSAHLARLNRLVQRFEPFIVSEHLAWSVWNGVYNPDLLPIPRSIEALRRVVDNVQRTQDAIKRTLLVENPSHYLEIPGHEYGEIEFLTELCRRTDCRLLLDVSNVYVSANNLGFDANAYIDAFPGRYVAELHLAGHSADQNLGYALLIDSHDAPVCAAVWQLYARLTARIGPRPTLIERDDDLPAFEVLLAERDRADSLMRTPAKCR